MRAYAYVPQCPKAEVRKVFKSGLAKAMLEQGNLSMRRRIIVLAGHLPHLFVEAGNDGSGHLPARPPQAVPDRVSGRRKVVARAVAVEDNNAAMTMCEWPDEDASETNQIFTAARLTGSTGQRPVPQKCVWGGDSSAGRGGES